MFTGCSFFIPHTKQLILSVVRLHESGQTYTEQICLQHWGNSTYTFLTDRCQAKVSLYVLCFLMSVDFPHSGGAFQIMKTWTQSKTRAGWLTTRTLYWESAFLARFQGIIPDAGSSKPKLSASHWRQSGRFTDGYRSPLIPSKFSITYR